jgi:hypothetical protein
MVIHYCHDLELHWIEGGPNYHIAYLSEPFHCYYYNQESIDAILTFDVVEFGRNVRPSQHKEASLMTSYM